MIQYQLSITAQSRPEMIERILRVVRHRGFMVNTMTLQQEPAVVLIIEMTVSSSRSIDLLFTQLKKLIDVDDVQIAQVKPQTQTQPMRA